MASLPSELLLSVHAHKLARYNNVSNHSCNMCSGSISSSDCYQCKSCDYDLCMACAYKQNPVADFASPLHTAHKLTISKKVSSRQCDACRGSISGDDCYQCKPCGFDLCMKCYAKQAVASVKAAAPAITKVGPAPSPAGSASAPASAATPRSAAAASSSSSSSTTPSASALLPHLELAGMPHEFNSRKHDHPYVLWPKVFAKSCRGCYSKMDCTNCYYCLECGDVMCLDCAAKELGISVPANAKGADHDCLGSNVREYSTPKHSCKLSYMGSARGHECEVCKRELESQDYVCKTHNWRVCVHCLYKERDSSYLSATLNVPTFHGCPLKFYPEIRGIRCNACKNSLYGFGWDCVEHKYGLCVKCAEKCAALCSGGPVKIELGTDPMYVSKKHEHPLEIAKYSRYASCDLCTRKLEGYDANSYFCKACDYYMCFHCIRKEMDPSYLSKTLAVATFHACPLEQFKLHEGNIINCDVCKSQFRKDTIMWQCVQHQYNLCEPCGKRAADLASGTGKINVGVDTLATTKHHPHGIKLIKTDNHECTVCHHPVSRNVGKAYSCKDCNFGICLQCLRQEQDSTYASKTVQLLAIRHPCKLKQFLDAYDVRCDGCSNYVSGEVFDCVEHKYVLCPKCATKLSANIPRKIKTGLHSAHPLTYHWDRKSGGAAFRWSCGKCGITEKECYRCDECSEFNLCAKCREEDKTATDMKEAGNANPDDDIYYPDSLEEKGEEDRARKLRDLHSQAQDAYKDVAERALKDPKFAKGECGKWQYINVLETIDKFRKSTASLLEDAAAKENLTLEMPKYGVRKVPYVLKEVINDKLYNMAQKFRDQFIAAEEAAEKKSADEQAKKQAEMAAKKKAAAMAQIAAAGGASASSSAAAPKPKVAPKPASTGIAGRPVIEDYKVIDNSEHYLNEQIEKLLVEGWQPFGGFSVVSYLNKGDSYARFRMTAALAKYATGTVPHAVIEDCKLIDDSSEYIGPQLEKLLADGWQPWGSPVVVAYANKGDNYMRFYHAMMLVKYAAGGVGARPPVVEDCKLVDDSDDYITTKLEALMAEGWQPFGNPVITTYMNSGDSYARFRHAALMVKYI